jgi:putative resolvase
VNLTEWARRQGVHPQTAYRWFRNGTCRFQPFERTNVRSWWLPKRSALRGPVALGLNARVSSHDQRSDLDRQVARLRGWAARTGNSVVRVEVEVEVGSGMNGSRSKLRRLLADPRVTMVVVEHRDRLARMNAELVEAALSAHGRHLVVLDDGVVDDDPVRDMRGGAHVVLRPVVRSPFGPESGAECVVPRGAQRGTEGVAVTGGWEDVVMSALRSLVSGCSEQAVWRQPGPVPGR